MRRIFTLSLLSALLFYGFDANSQACSPPVSCTPLGTVLAGGGFEDPGLTPCAVQGTAYSHAIQFNMYNTFNFLGTQSVDSIEILAIDNLPCGLCWSLDQADNRYSANEAGCLTISGTTNDANGQYKLEVTLNAWMNQFPVSQTIPPNLADQMGIRVFLGVQTSAGTCLPIDTSINATNLNASFGSCDTVLALSLGADQTVCHDSVITLNPTIAFGVQPYTYLWSITGDTLSCNNCENPTITVTQNSSLSVTVTDVNSVTASATLNVFDNACNSCHASFIMFPDSAQGVYNGYNLSTGYNLSYMWYFGDGDSSAQLYPVHNYTQPGQYYVCLTVFGNGGCTNTFCDSSFYVFKTEAGLMSQLIIVNTTGIKEEENAAKMVLYPNPASTQLFIETNGITVSQINIYNTTGSVVSQTKQLQNKSIDISELANGVYITEIKTKEATVRRRWIKM